MKIIVCIKQVPNTNEVKLDPIKGTLIRDGVPSIINPDDKAGLEAALSLKEIYGGEVSVISMGPPRLMLFCVKRWQWEQTKHIWSQTALLVGQTRWQLPRL